MKIIKFYLSCVVLICDTLYLLEAYSFAVISEVWGSKFFPDCGNHLQVHGMSISNLHLLYNLQSQLLLQLAASSIVVFSNQS
jgi:hypothetical protein